MWLDLPIGNIDQSAETASQSKHISHRVSDHLLTRHAIES